jgi:hypothetical protein
VCDELEEHADAHGLWAGNWKNRTKEEYARIRNIARLLKNDKLYEMADQALRWSEAFFSDGPNVSNFHLFVHISFPRSPPLSCVLPSLFYHLLPFPAYTTLCTAILFLSALSCSFLLFFCPPPIPPQPKIVLDPRVAAFTAQELELSPTGGHYDVNHHLSPRVSVFCVFFFLSPLCVFFFCLTVPTCN